VLVAWAAVPRTGGSYPAQVFGDGVRLLPPPKGVDRSTQLRHHLGARIRALRDARGLTQEMIAGRIDGTQKYVSQLESAAGHAAPAAGATTAPATPETRRFDVAVDILREIIVRTDALGHATAHQPERFTWRGGSQEPAALQAAHPIPGRGKREHVR
jgi:transcriptional regulator with XRE-family HTH domain